MDSQSTVSNEKYEKLMEEIGEFGKFQKRLCLLLVLSTVPNGYFALSMVFIGRTPPSYKCFVPGDENGSLSDWKTTIVPGIGTTYGETQTDNTENSTTKLLDEKNECSLPGESGINSTNVTGCPYGYVYSFEQPERTSIVTEWNLVCDREWIIPTIMSIYMGGVLVGSLLSGTMSDRFGRYPTFLTGTLMMYVFLGLCGVASSPPVFATFLFLAGAFGFVNYVAAFIIAAEMINTKDRVVIGTLTVGGFAGGYMLLPLFAYYIANWRVLCAVLAALGVLYIPYIWLMTESPRWLYSKGKKDKFIALFLKMAKVNGVSDERAKYLIAKFYNGKGVTEEALLVKDMETEAAKFSVRREYSYFDLLRFPIARPRTLCMWLTWFVCSVVYYGVAFNTSNMGGDPYINCFVAAAVEIPAYAMAICLLKWRGRKPILISTLLVAGLTCSAVPYLKQINNDLAITFAMIGKLSISAAFSIIFIVCSELFPTLMRSMAVGSSSMLARVGGMVAPYLLYLGKSHESAPYLIMGVLAVVAAALNILLPETGDTKLPETLDDLDPLVYPTCNGVQSKGSKRGNCDSTPC